MWLVASLVANVAVIALEYTYRARLFPNIWDGWWLVVPLAIVVQAALFYAFAHAPTYLLAWAVFFTVNAALRTGVAVAVLHEPFGLTTAVGLATIAAGALMLKLS